MRATASCAPTTKPVFRLSFGWCKEILRCSSTVRLWERRGPASPTAAGAVPELSIAEDIVNRVATPDRLRAAVAASPARCRIEADRLGNFRGSLARNGPEQLDGSRHSGISLRNQQPPHAFMRRRVVQVDEHDVGVLRLDHIGSIVRLLGNRIRQCRYRRAATPRTRSWRNTKISSTIKHSGLAELFGMLLSAERTQVQRPMVGPAQNR